MKKLLLLLILITSFLQAFEYKPSIGIKGIYPIEIKYLESTAKCGELCIGEINAKPGVGFIFNNDFKLSSFLTLSLEFSYEHNITNSYRTFDDMAETHISQTIKSTLISKFFYTNELYSSLGFSYNYYINNPYIVGNYFSGNLGLGYLFNNFGFELSIEGKVVDIEVKSRGYLNLGISAFYFL